jgi:hypothetical protein
LDFLAWVPFSVIPFFFFKIASATIASAAVYDLISGFLNERFWPGGCHHTPSNSSENDLGKKILGLFLILTLNNHMSKKKFKTKNRAQSFGDAML